MSKGSKQRPTNKASFDAGWDRIFSKKESKFVGSLICSKCKVDRAKDSCPLSNNPSRMFSECPMIL